jgi:hypothetical protein
MEQPNTNASAPENATIAEPVPQAPQGQPDLGAADSTANQTAEAQKDPSTEPPVVETTPQGDNQDEGIPTKWVGKSLEDVIHAHREAERRMHELSEENSKLKKEQEAVKAETVAKPEITPPVAQVKSMDDWIQEEFQKDWQQDPQDAVVKRDQRRDQWRTYQDNYNKQLEFGQAAQAGKVPGYEDFGELLPTMQTANKEFGPLINPVYETHPLALRAVYLIAKGLASTEKLKKTATSKTQVSKAIEQEKIAGAAETVSPSANDTVNPWEMKTEDLAKLIGRVDRSVEG